MTTSYYGFTIKNIRHNAHSTVHELQDVMHRLIKSHKAIYVDHFIETDSLQRLHIHGTFMARKGILLSKFKEKFQHIHIDYLPTTADVHNWSIYIRKCQPQSEQDQIVLDDYPFI
ncbi:MAG: hypothetical protein [Cressdnaviricota sp.]|nr:MAG: hypothetical protein [Cressdnaviricota sp.]